MIRRHPRSAPGVGQRGPRSTPATSRPSPGAAVIFLAWIACVVPLCGQDPAVEFGSGIQPVLQTYCLPCHSTKKQKGELDLESLASFAEARRHPNIWQAVADQLAHNEMPPAEEEQPSAAEKARLVAWIQTLLENLALERAGDPGPVVLRRLSNPEYTYTVRDLTGVGTLDPAREFPIDGAAGEGFMNTGQALVMSPSLVTKYLDAGKVIASHAVLLPDGIGFSAGASRRDQTEEILAQIRSLYAEFADAQGGAKVDLQGILLETNTGGRLPLEKYLAATLAEREALAAGTKSVDSVARERNLSARYLGGLMGMLTSREPSLLLDELRTRWRASPPDGAAALVADVAVWQNALWKFNSVGHIGKLNGPKTWMEQISPLVTSQELRLKLPPAGESGAVSFFLAATDAGDGNGGDAVVWTQPRLIAPGRPDLPLRDVRALTRDLARRREMVFGQAAACLDAAAEAGTPGKPRDLPGLARAHGVKAEALGMWFDFLGVAAGVRAEVADLLTTPILGHGKYDFVQGWGSPEAPYILANSSDQTVRIPGSMGPHSLAVLPSLRRKVAVGWRSPGMETLRIEGTVTHAHIGCGNGVRWSLDLRRGQTRQTLASGKVGGGKEVKVGPLESVAVQPGDLLSLLISANGDQGCDLTGVDMVLTGGGATPRTWSLVADVSSDLPAANPRADRFGHDAVWHFYTEADEAATGTERLIPAGSLLAKWQTAPAGEEKRRLARAIQTLLTGPVPAERESPDANLLRALTAFGGPLFPPGLASRPVKAGSVPKEVAWGLDPARFGRSLPGGAPVDAASLAVSAPEVLEVRLPAELAEGSELVVTGMLDPRLGQEGSVQLQVVTARPRPAVAVLMETKGDGAWTSDNRKVAHTSPVLVREGSRAQARFASGFDDFRRWFPAALCYSKIVPVDEVVTLTLFHREDEPLVRLMLDDGQTAKLDRLWDQLRYVSQDALTLVDAFEQIWQYATQDGDPKALAFEPLRQPIADRAAALRQRLVETEPRHVGSLLEIAERAYRRPLAAEDRDELAGLYRTLRAQELPHEEAIRLVLARIFVSPLFLYRSEAPTHATDQRPVTDWELATRLSYFLWSSLPDAPLREAAAAGQLRAGATLAAQTRRMLAGDRVRRLATEFACQWLHIRDFDTLDEKSERHFPTFIGLRTAMYEESIRFFTDFFQSDRPVLSILDSDHTFLNEALAVHYGIPGVSGEAYRRVDGLKAYARGGILGQATTLAKHSGASRTSPILRGNWVSEVLLGEKLPRPPKDVPQLPADEATELLTVRELTARHTADPRCSGCHARIDPFGFALEEFDAVGRRRDHDLGGRPIDTKTRTKDGVDLEGMAGLRTYLSTTRQDAFLRQFNRKLLGYALGRSVSLSDEPLLAEMKSRLQANDFRVSVAIDVVVQSRQFREIRGRETRYED